jgi:hypothetical protein
MPTTLPTSGQSIIVDTPETVSASSLIPDVQPGQRLVSWIVERANKWRDHRNRGYERRWGEYWRMWRGQWASNDRSRQTERSRLVAPALAQAIEMTVSEIEEAVFSKDTWFDVVDDIADQDKVDAIRARDLLIEDFELVNAKDAMSEAILNAALFGTGIVKISTEVRRAERPVRNQETQQLTAEGMDRVYVTVDSIRPDEFIPDPAGRTISEMLACAHEVDKPMHSVLEKIEQGIYRRDALNWLFPTQSTEQHQVDQDDPEGMLAPGDADSVTIIEWHGKVPLNLLRELTERQEPDNPLDRLLEQDMAERPDVGDGPLIEAIVTIANGSVLLRAMANPFVMKDRSIIAFQFEKVPGRFWGRSVSEKGYNPQKALDAEIRARIDALGFVSSPMLGVDSGRIPKGFKMEVYPGKIWLTQGNPNEILSPVGIGDINPNTFNQASEMERMVQMGTGAFDSATALKQQSQSGSNALSANSMLMGAFVKRSKRAIANVDRNLLQPVIKKAMWRYMQFEPRRYPNDYEFIVKATLGIVAREVEAMQMTQLIGMMPEQFGNVSLRLVQGIVEHSSSPVKADVMEEIAKALAPPPPEEQQKQKELADLQFEAAKGQAQKVLLENQKLIADTRLVLAKALAEAKKSDVEDDKLIQEQMRLELELQQLDILREQNRIALAKIAVDKQKIDAQKNKPSSK